MDFVIANRIKERIQHHLINSVFIGKVNGTGTHQITDVVVKHKVCKLANRTIKISIDIELDRGTVCIHIIDFKILITVDC